MDQISVRKKCIDQFIKSKLDYLLILHNTAILDDFTTISTLVKQNLPVIVPMLQTNIYSPTYERKDCDFGWGRTMVPVNLWLTPGHLAIDPRIKVSSTFCVEKEDSQK